MLVADWYHHSAAGFDLSQQRGLYVIDRGRYQDRVERRRRLPTEIAVANRCLDCAMAGAIQRATCLVTELWHDLYAANLGAECAQDRSLITGARAKFKDPLPRSHLEQLSHDCSDEGLWLRLTVADRYGAVTVSDGALWSFGTNSSRGTFRKASRTVGERR